MTLPGDWRRLFAGCDDEQREAITSSAAPLLVVAGAGSGKTRVLTHRIAWRVVEETAAPAHVLALTFTRKAATELRTRLSHLGLPAPVTAGTFHAVALAELRRRALDTGRTPPVIVESKARLLGAAMGERVSAAPARRGGRPLERRELLAALAGEIEWAKARLVSPDRYAAAAAATGRTTPLEPAAVAAAYAAYEREKRRRRVLDFDDLLVDLAAAIHADADFAAAQRWRFAHLFVDELQDANAAQLRLLDAWLGGRADLFAVGDPRQAIYGWNGADPGAVATFADRYPGATVLRLDANYRSTPQVVAVAAAALASRVHGGSDHPGGGRGELAPTTPTSSRPDGAVPTLRAFPTGEAEAAGVAAALRLAHRPGRRWSQCAVLARTNAQLNLFEEALGANGIPFRSAAGPSFLSRPAVRSALGALRPAADTRSLRAFLDDLDERAAGAAGEGAGADPEAPSAAGPGGDSAGDLFDLAALARLGREYAEFDAFPTGDGFLGYLQGALRRDPSPSSADAVELATFHRAKGLEWPVVFVTGLEDGLVPIAHARSPEALEEERRLLYVALSRAEEELHCSWAEQRAFGSRTVAREPSPHLEAIDAARRALERMRSPDASRVREALAASRAALGGRAPSSRLPSTT